MPRSRHLIGLVFAGWLVGAALHAHPAGVALGLLVAATGFGLGGASIRATGDFFLMFSRGGHLVRFHEGARQAAAGLFLCAAGLVLVALGRLSGQPPLEGVVQAVALALFGAAVALVPSALRRRDWRAEQGVPVRPGRSGARFGLAPTLFFGAVAVALLLAAALRLGAVLRQASGS